MRHPLLLLGASLLSLAAPAAGQMCAPLLPSGQPALMPFTPVCVGAIAPPAVWAGGNPAFALSSFAPPPVPPGLMTFLVIGVPLPPPVPIPAPPLHPAFAAPGLLASPVGLILAVVPAGPSGPVPGPPLPFPIPPTGGPLGLAASVHTIVVIPAGILPPGGIALTGATGITI